MVYPYKGGIYMENKEEKWVAKYNKYKTMDF